MSSDTDIRFNIQVDCEATQHSVNDPTLGEREPFAGSGRSSLKPA